MFILDGHSSHITLEVVHEARSAGLDLLTLPSHTSHALQPLDVAVFKPFKQYFSEYRDYWTSRHLNEKTSRETLAHWVSLALRKALSSSNIMKGFERTGKTPLNRNAVVDMLKPSEAFENANSDSMQQSREVETHESTGRASIPGCEDSLQERTIVMGEGMGRTSVRGARRGHESMGGA